MKAAISILLAGVLAGRGSGRTVELEDSSSASEHLCTDFTRSFCGSAAGEADLLESMRLLCTETDDRFTRLLGKMRRARAITSTFFPRGS